MPRPERSEFDKQARDWDRFVTGPRESHSHDERLLGIDRWADRDQHNARDAFRHAYAMCRLTEPLPVQVRDVVLGVAVLSEVLQASMSTKASARDIFLMDVVNFVHGY